MRAVIAMARQLNARLHAAASPFFYEKAIYLIFCYYLYIGRFYREPGTANICTVLVYWQPNRPTWGISLAWQGSGASCGAKTCLGVQTGQDRPRSKGQTWCAVQLPSACACNKRIAGYRCKTQGLRQSVQELTPAFRSHDRARCAIRTPSSCRHLAQFMRTAVSWADGLCPGCTH